MNNSDRALKAAALAAAFFISASVQAEEPKHYLLEFGVQSFQANNATSIDQFDDRFQGFSPRHGQLYGLAENHAYLKASRDEYLLQAYKRQEIFINAGRDTGQLYADINARVRPSSTRQYPIDFDGYGIEQTGLGFSKAFTVNDFQFEPGLRIYNIDRYREIQAQGMATARADGSYDIGLVTMERDTEADFQFPQGASPSGLGYALDLDIKWHDGQGTRAFLSLENLVNTNEIRNAPTTAQVINSNVNQFDADGFLNYNPAIQGRNSREPYRFSLPVKTHVGVSHALDGSYSPAVGLDVRQIDGLVMPRLSSSLQIPAGWIETVTVGYESHFQAFDVAARFKQGGIKVGFDTLNAEKRRVEYLQVFWSLRL